MESDTINFDDINVANMEGEIYSQVGDSEAGNFLDSASVNKPAIWRTEEMENKFLCWKETLEEKLKTIQDDFEERISQISRMVDEKFDSLQSSLETSNEKAEERICAAETKVDAAVEALSHNKPWKKALDEGASGDAPGAGGEPAAAETQLQGNTPSSAIVTGAKSRAKCRQQSHENKSEEFTEKMVGPNESTISCSLERRVEALESAVQRALYTLFPRVENLLQQFEAKACEEEASHAGGSDEAPEDSSVVDAVASEETVAAAAAEAATGAAEATPPSAPPEIGTSAEEDPPMPTDSTPRPSTASSAMSVCLTPSSKGQGFSKHGGGSGGTFGSAEAQRRLNFHFIQASKRGCAHEMRYYHELGADVNARDHHGKSALHHAVGAEAVAGAAAKARGAEAVAYLLSLGADVSLRALHGWTPLHDAARAGHAPHVEALVRHGADAAAEDDYGYTALHWAAFKGRLEVATTLLRLAQPPDGVSGAVSSADKRGRTPLYYAAQQGHAQLVVALAGSPSSGARLSLDQRDCEGSTALHAAAAGGQEAAVKALLSVGASIGVKDRMYRTAFDVAKNDAIRKAIKAGPN